MVGGQVKPVISVIIKQNAKVQGVRNQQRG